MAGNAAQGRLGIYLPTHTIKKLKLAGVERGKPVNTLVNEALAFWWKSQPESKQGPLFEVEEEAPAASETEEAFTKASAGSVTKAPLPKAPSKGSRK